MTKTKDNSTARTVAYCAHAHVTGGREHGRGHTPDGLLDIALRLPPELGGEGDGVNPEQLFAVGYAACFEAVLGLAASRRRVASARLAGLAIDARVMLVSIPDDGFVLAAELAVALPALDDPELAAKVVLDAHELCPYSKAIRGNVDVTLAVNGEAI